MKTPILFAACAAMFGIGKIQEPMKQERKRIDDKFGEGTSNRVMRKIKTHSEKINKAEAKRHRKQQKRLNDNASCLVCNNCA